MRGQRAPGKGGRQIPPFALAGQTLTLGSFGRTVSASPILFQPVGGDFKLKLAPGVGIVHPANEQRLPLQEHGISINLKLPQCGMSAGVLLAGQRKIADVTPHIKPPAVVPLSQPGPDGCTDIEILKISFSVRKFSLRALAALFAAKIPGIVNQDFLLSTQWFREKKNCSRFGAIALAVVRGDCTFGDDDFGFDETSTAKTLGFMVGARMLWDARSSVRAEAGELFMMACGTSSDFRTRNAIPAQGKRRGCPQSPKLQSRGFFRHGA